MKLSEIELPSNRKFGLLFTCIFLIATAYCVYTGNMGLAYAFALIASIFLFITVFKSDLLLPLNKLWMRFGLLLGMVVSPIVLGMMFFGLFTTTALLMRLGGRDQLRLKFSQKASHWIARQEPIEPESFKNQF